MPGQVFYEVTRRMLRLYHDSSISEQTVSDLQFIDSLVDDRTVRLKIAPHILSLGLVELCQHICRRKMFHEKLFVETDKQLSVGTKAASLCLSCVVNLADTFPDACQRIIDIGLHEDLFRFLNLDSMDPSKIKLRYIRSHFADAAISMAYNVIQASQQF